MELKVIYRANRIPGGATLIEDELFMSVTKVEAFEVCQDNYIYERLDGNAVVQKVLARAEKKACSEILKKEGLRKNQYELEIELKPAESNLFTNAFIKEFFKWLLKDAYEMNCTIHNDHGLSDFFHSAINAFARYYKGNLHMDAVAIQERIIRK